MQQNNEQVQNRGASKDNWWDKLPRAQWGRYQNILTGQNWFEVYRIDENLYAIYEPGQFEEVISYLILGEQRALLFDTGLGIGDIRKVVDQLTDLPVSVLNSHTHYDHIGGNYQFDDLERTYAMNTPFTLKHAQGESHAEVAFAVAEGWIWKPVPAGFDRQLYRVRPFAIAETVIDGSTIDLGGRTLQVLVTPGHAPDAICLLDRKNRLLFTGDTFYLAPLYAHLEGSSFPDYVRTASRLAGFADEVDQIVMSHNVPLASSRYLLEMDRAFQSILQGNEVYLISDGNREYPFGNFSIIVKGEPPN